MNAHDAKFLAARVAALDVVVENMLIDALRAASDPVAMGRDFIERIEASAIKNHDPPLPTDVAEMMHNAIVGLVERAIAKLKRTTGE